MGNKFRFLVLFGTMAVFFSCVTVNVYFPAKEVEQKAGDIVDDIRKTAPAPSPSGYLDKAWNGILYGFWFDGGSVWAQQPDSPAIQSLKKQMGDRFPRLRPFFQKGALGENNKGFLEIRDGGGLSAADKTEVKSLVEAENRDRQALYSEVAKSMNIAPDQVIRVQRIFAGKWQQSSAPGWWVQREDGKWAQKN